MESNQLFVIFYRDRFATPVNVWSNCVACVIIEHYSRKELQLLHNVTKRCEEKCSTVSDDTVAIEIVDSEKETMEDHKHDHADNVAIHITDEVTIRN